jgi:hypothetical protein
MFGKEKMMALTKNKTTETQTRHLLFVKPDVYPFNVSKGEQIRPAELQRIYRKEAYYVNGKMAEKC